MVNWTETLRLIDKTKGTVTPVVINGDSSGSLLSWKNSVSATHTGIKKTNGGTVVLRIDALGTFIRQSPILNDQNAKFNYLIEYQISQDVNSNGIYVPSRLFRMEIRNAIIELVDGVGECLNITCIEQQYRLKEAFDSINNYFLTPLDEVTSRAINFNSANPRVLRLTVSVPDPTAFNTMGSDSLQNNWLPQGPTSFHELDTNVISTLSGPPSAGGTLTDFYFDFDPDPTQTKTINQKFDIYGNTSSGVTISPTKPGVVGMQLNQSNNLSSQNYKNQVIFKGNATSGSLPMETVKFNSAYTHAEGYDGFGGRPIWSSASVSYVVNDLVKRTLSISNGTSTFNTSRYFKCVRSHTSNGANDPILDNGTFWFEDFTIIPEWVPFSHFFAGDIVTVTNSGNVNYFIAKVDMTFSSVPTIDANWLSIWFNRPSVSYQPFYSYTPWTSDYNDWLTNISGSSFTTTSGTSYLGFFVDWNYTVANYDPKTRSNEFSYISMKSVSYYQNGPPADPNEIFEGQRILVKSPGSGPFAGHENRIAQYDNTIGNWQFSNAPVTNDVVSILSIPLVTSVTGFLTYRWDGGNWVTLPLGPNNTTALHPIKDMYLTKGASGIASQAIEARFNYTTSSIWSVIGLAAIPAPFNFDDNMNLNSRGMWLNFWFPYPRRKTNSNNPVGYRYGQNIGTSSALGTLNTFNLDGDRHGLAGWNQGINSEDMGRITGVHFKIKPSFFRVDRTNGSGILTQGYDNQAFTFWAVDMFDRVFYQDFQCRINGAFETIDVQFGANANQLLYFNRLDELQLLGGFTSPWNFFLKEKEFTGVAFDWRFVKSCGWQWKGANDETNQYKTATEQGWTGVWNGALQILNGSAAAGALASAFNTNNELDYGTLALDEFYFIKELYVNSSDTVLTDPRVTVEYDDSEPDYYNAKAKAQAISLRDQYYPLFTTYEATGDVRMKFGQTFTVSGTRVVGGSDTLVCSEVTHVTDKTGYHMSVTGVKKFVLPILTISPLFGNLSTNFTVTGTSFSKNGTTLLFSDGGNIGTAFNDPSGGFTFILLASSFFTVGQHTITATDQVTGVSTSVLIQVVS